MAAYLARRIKNGAATIAMSDSQRHAIGPTQQQDNKDRGQAALTKIRTGPEQSIAMRMAASGHGEKNSQRAYLVSIAQ